MKSKSLSPIQALYVLSPHLCVGEMLCIATGLYRSEMSCRQFPSEKVWLHEMRERKIYVVRINMLCVGTELVERMIC